MRTLELQNIGLSEIKAVDTIVINGGHSESEIRFLMDANGWSRSTAVECLDLANQYACRP
ncbi:MAG: hypothetical protein ACK5YS_03845 [bacterium]|jgi:hypothetical protein